MVGSSENIGTLFLSVLECSPFYYILWHALNGHCFSPLFIEHQTITIMVHKMNKMEVTVKSRTYSEF